MNSRFEYKPVEAQNILEELLSDLRRQIIHDINRTSRTGPQDLAETPAQTVNRDAAAFARMELINRLAHTYDIELDIYDEDDELQEIDERLLLIKNGYKKK